MSDAVAVAQAPATSPSKASTPAVDSSLPYSNIVPGAVIGRWAQDTEPALMVAPDKLIDLLMHLRDNESYDFLSSVTCVDYQSYKGKLRAGIKERFDTVYHLYSTKKGGGPVVLHVPVPQSETVPSATSVYPGASLQECEVYDLYGIKFDGHPNLRRIPHVGRLSGLPNAQGLEGSLFRRGGKTLQESPSRGRLSLARRQAAVEVQFDLS
jgi:NADH:ubiquinone oxidoreductase subunit C